MAEWSAAEARERMAGRGYDEPWYADLEFPDIVDLLRTTDGDLRHALAALAEACGERERLARRLHIWQKVARRQREKAQHNFVWGQQWQEYYRQEEALLHEVLAAQAVAPIPEGN